MIFRGVFSDWDKDGRRDELREDAGVTAEDIVVTSVTSETREQFVWGRDCDLDIVTGQNSQVQMELCSKGKGGDVVGFAESFLLITKPQPM